MDRRPKLKRKAPSDFLLEPLKLVFSEIPAHNQIDVLKKLDFREFARFKQCSKETVEITQNFGHRLPLEVFEIYCMQNTFTMLIKGSRMTINKTGLRHLLDEHLALTLCTFRLHAKMSEENFAFLESVRRKTNMITQRITLFWHADENIEPAMFDRLGKMLDCTVLNTIGVPSSFLLQLSELKTISFLHFSMGTMEVDLLLQLKAPSIVLDFAQVDPAAITLFLTHWMEESREITKFFISPYDFDDLTIFDDLHYTILHSAESHRSSPFAWLQIKKGIDFRSPQRYSKEIQLKKICSFERIDRKKLFVAIKSTTDNKFEIEAREYKEIKEIEEWIRRNFDQSFRWP